MFDCINCTQITLSKVARANFFYCFVFVLLMFIFLFLFLGQLLLVYFRLVVPPICCLFFMHAVCCMCSWQINDDDLRIYTVSQKVSTFKLPITLSNRKRFFYIFTLLESVGTFFETQCGTHLIIKRVQYADKKGLHEPAYQQSFYTLVFIFLWLHSDDSHRALSPPARYGSRPFNFRFGAHGTASLKTLLLRLSAKMLICYVQTIPW